MQVHLGQALLPGNRTALYCSSDGPCLVFATAAGKVLVHNPHEASNSSSSSRGQPHLNINKQITALAAGPLLPQCPERDVLLIGTPNFLQAYDIQQNRDLFFKDVPDGVSCIVVGRTGSATTPLAIVGGSCSVQGFDSSGQEVFWSVTGGNVTALALADIDEDGQNELLVGCDDADIRVFKDEQLLLQLPEADVVVGLAGLGRCRFAYALRNGTIGAYQGGTRLWRVKSKHSVSCIAAFDLNGDSVLELISGWSNGKVEARSAASGDVVARDSLGSGVAGLLTGQLRDAAAAAAGQDGSGSAVELELIAASSEGELRGYQTHHAELQAENPGDISMQQQALIDLAQKKQELIYELSSYQQQQPQQPQGVVGALGIAAGVGLGAAAAGGAGSLAAGDIASMIPPDTRVDSCIALNKVTLSCELTLRTNNASVIKAALIFGEQVFQGESLFVRPPQPSSSLTVQLAPARDTPVMLLMKVLVGSRTSQVYHVFELEIELPKYAMYAAEERALPAGPPASHVSFVMQHPATRVASWIESRFNTKPNVGSGATSLDAAFTCMRSRQPLVVCAATTGSGGLRVRLHCESMELAGELLQDLAAYVGVTELNSTASFPAAMEQFKSTLATVEACSATRSLVEGDTAALCASIKAGVVRAEDARLLGDMAALRRQHRRLADLNRDMWGEHSKRAANQAELVQGLKAINLMIQQAAKLRVGPAQARVVAACRAAIKANNLQALSKVVCEGSAAAGV
uniref:Bardet-Biedl syndrome 2 protein homolog n=1 Tax=Tetradesmus obliquus TaxID=3088 RepID=A0A383WCU1_TETOB|eukprot:jgi/Sobl393_1/6721/SZX74516.1